MHEGGLARLGVAVLCVVAARLIVVGIGDRTDFFVNAHGRDPHLDVVGAGHTRAAVARRQLAETEVQTEFLHQAAGLADQLFECLFAVLGMSVLHHLHLVELVPANHAALL